MPAADPVKRARDTTLRHAAAIFYWERHLSTDRKAWEALNRAETDYDRACRDLVRVIWASAAGTPAGGAS
jgi:hypothetical protein